MHAHDAMIPVNDRGFLFADGVYEVIACRAGQFIELPAHLARLKRSLHALDIRCDPSITWETLIHELLTRHDPHAQKDWSVYCQVTRGTQAVRRHAAPHPLQPNIYLCLNAWTPSLIEGKAITYPDLRWGRCDIKSTCLLPNTLAATQAEKQDAIEAILLRDGHVTEGSCSNVFWYHQGTLFTPSTSANILPGITRQSVLTHAKKMGIPTQFHDHATRNTLYHADELFITSTTKRLARITQLDHVTYHPKNDGVLSRLQQADSPSLSHV